MLKRNRSGVDHGEKSSGVMKVKGGGSGGKFGYEKPKPLGRYLG